MSLRKGVDWDAVFAAHPEKSIRAIAKLLGVNPSSAHRAAKTRGIDTTRHATDPDPDPETLRSSPRGSSAAHSSEAYADTVISSACADSLPSPSTTMLPPAGQPMRDPWMHSGGAPSGYHLQGVTTHPDGTTTHQTRIGERKHIEEHQPAVPTDHLVRGVSTYLDANGAVVGQWVKTDLRREAQMNALMVALERIAEPLRGERDPVPAPASCNSDLLAFIPWGDPHIGMYAWAKETGESWDLEIAERVHVEAVTSLIAVSPPAARAHIALLGDNLHADNDSARTPKSGHALDVDSRFPKVLGVAVRAVRRCVDLALAKFPAVDVTILRGNHDPTAAVALEYTLAALYEREPRVCVDTSPAQFRCVEWGSNLIGLAHGDTRRIAEMCGMMPRLWPKAWGRTRHRHWYTGHVHHDRLLDLQDGSTAESMRTLAAKDAYAAAGGWASGRDMKLDVIHRERGRITRHCVGIESLSGAA